MVSSEALKRWSEAMLWHSRGRRRCCFLRLMLTAAGRGAVGGIGVGIPLGFPRRWGREGFWMGRVDWRLRHSVGLAGGGGDGSG